MRKTLRASPAALVAMHSNRPSSQGPGLAMSSDPEDCKLCGQRVHGGQPLSHGEQREERQIPPYGGTLRWARWPVLRVPVGAGREVWVQGAAILLPPDVGLGGSPGVTAQRGRLLSQQGEVGGPRGDGRRDCGRAWQ